MPANNTCWVVHCWATAYGNVGHLYTPARSEGMTYPHIPYAIDPGTYTFRDDPDAWDPEKYRRMLDWASVQRHKPIWVALPDVVYDATRTFGRWHQWVEEVQGYGWPVALVVQDGMTPASIADQGISPDVIFIGGSTEWKWGSLASWCQAYPRVHVGRVNSTDKLWLCKRQGVESVDGTGWFRGRLPQIKGLEEFLRTQMETHHELPLLAEASRTGRTKGPKQEGLFG